MREGLTFFISGQGCRLRAGALSERRGGNGRLCFYCCFKLTPSSAGARPCWPLPLAKYISCFPLSTMLHNDGRGHLIGGRGDKHTQTGRTHTSTCTQSYIDTIILKLTSYTHQRHDMYGCIDTITRTNMFYMSRWVELSQYNTTCRLCVHYKASTGQQSKEPLPRVKERKALLFNHEHVSKGRNKNRDCECQIKAAVFITSAMTANTACQQSP